MTGPIDPAELEGDDLTHTPEPAGVRVPTHLYEVASDEVIAVLNTITDPASRFWACENAAQAADQRGRIAEVRREAVRELRAVDEVTGRPRRSLEEIGELLGMSTARVAQLAGPAGSRSLRGPRSTS